MYTSTVLGVGKCVLFREVSLIRGVLLDRFPCSGVVVCMFPY